MRNFRDKERCCEATFQSRQSYWHFYTNGKDMPIIFTDNREMALAMNIVAQAAFVYAEKVTIIAFTVMNNHFHFILEGDFQLIKEMLSFILKRLRRVLSLEKLPEVSSKPIEDIASMRNHIVYVHRNGYVANLNHTPFSYPWGTGAHYFMPVIHGKPFSEITSVENRLMFRSRDIKLPLDWHVINSGGALYIAPPSFCDIALGMKMFHDAHHYFAIVSKNVEAFSGVAVEINDGEFLTDQELFAQVIRIVREKYRLASSKDLTGAQRLDLAKTLHYDYRSSKGQIRRVLGLNQYDIDSLFPRGI